MKRFISTILIVCALVLLNTGCSKKTVNVTSAAAYTNFETTCLGIEQDGSQTLRAWGKGRNKADAIEQAKKNAVSDVLFKGIKGSGECNQTPLVLEVNGRERYAKYFNPFFSDGGEYKQFVVEEKSNEASRIKARGSAMENWGIIVTVDREGLRQQLEKDGILKEGLTY